MNALADLIHAVFSIYIYLLIASALFSWLVAFNVVNTSNRFVFMLLSFLHRITEPALRPHPAHHPEPRRHRHIAGHPDPDPLLRPRSDRGQHRAVVQPPPAHPGARRTGQRLSPSEEHP